MTPSAKTRRGKTNEGDMRTPFFLAYDAENCTHVKLHGKEIDDLVKRGQAVSAKFVIPYPPGFPIMVPGQVITRRPSPSCASSM